MRLTSRPLRRRRPWLALTTVVLLAGCAPTTRHVIYTVTSKANAVDIASVNDYGESEQRVVKPPWIHPFLADPHSLLSVSAQAMGPNGGVACEIAVDGVKLQGASATGVGSVAACNAEAP